MAVVADKSMLEAYGREDLEAFLFTVMGVVSVVTFCSGGMWVEWAYSIAGANGVGGVVSIVTSCSGGVWAEWAYSSINTYLL